MPRVRTRFVAALALVVALWLATGSAVSAAPVDVRGSWAGTAVTDIGTFPNTLDFKTEDFATGAVAGDANAGTYTLSGTVTGSSIMFRSSQNGTGYSSTTMATISPDGTTMSGTFSDTNGRSGTTSFTRQGAAPSAPIASPSTSAPGCTFGGSGGGPSTITESGSDPSIVRVLGDAANPIIAPSEITLDTGDPRGRVFVANLRPAHTITVIRGRTLNASDIAVETIVDVPGYTADLAVDPGSGRIFVSDTATCRIHVIDGRALVPSASSSIDLPGNPEAIAFEPTTGRLVVSLPISGELVVFNRDLTIAGMLTVPVGNVLLQADATRSGVFIATGRGGPGVTSGSLSFLDLSAAVPRIEGALDIGPSAAIAEDPGRGLVFVVTPLSGELSTISIGPAGALTPLGAISVSIPFAQNAGQNSSYAVVFVGGGGQILVTAGSSEQAALFTEDANGTPVFTRSIAGVAGGVAAVADPTTGRVFVAELPIQRVAVLDLGGSAAPAPALPYVLPGPLDISLAPQDVARSVGITAFIMLLLGAPTPLFNSTLGANRKLIERWVRRRRPRRLRGSSPGLAALGRRLAALSHTWIGLALYLLLATLLYAFLSPTFPFSDGARTFGTTLFAIVFGTAVSQLPAERFVRRKYQQRGTVNVALWTIGLAAGCVLITRISAIQPGYVYGIIGGFTFKVALSPDDRGRMAWRGMTILLAAGFAAWLLRIPFQPGSGSIGGDVGAIGNQLLAGVFISAVESSAIGLIPLRFMAGAALFSWNRLRWAFLWALGLLLFAHVLLYPVSSLEPSPKPTGLWTAVASVCIYGAIAIGFWGFFQRRARRHQRRVLAAAAARATRSD